MNGVEEDSRKLDRTWLCSVLFLDIVDYSSQPVETQVQWKAFFNGCLSESLVSVLSDDRIVLDTGDGAVVCFLGDPEAALLASLSILNQFRNQAMGDGPSALVRVGINLGPIRLIRDINSQLNAVGDGINVGQRVMSFAGGNQLLISRSYYEVISTLSANYKSLFRFDGVRQDKHVREHTVYALVQGPDEAAPSQAEAQQVAKQNGVPTFIFHPDDLTAIEKSLSNFVGPIAIHLVKKASLQANSLGSLCEILAQGSVPAVDRSIFLKRCLATVAARPGAGTAAPTHDKPVMQPAMPVATKQWDSQFLDKVRKELAQFVGPIAGVLVTRVSGSASSQEEIYDLLAQQISSEAERKKFLSLRR